MLRDLAKVKSPFFNPLWRRVLVVALAGGWALVELATGNYLWAAAFGAAAAWCAHQFFIDWEYQVPPDEGE